MVLKFMFMCAVIGLTIAASNGSFVLAANIQITVLSQVMAPAMELDPEKVTVQIGDSVTWENLTGQGIKVTPDWDETQPLPPYIRPGGRVGLRFDQAGTYRYSVFTATDRFEDDRIPTAVHGIIQVQLPEP